MTTDGAVSTLTPADRHSRRRFEVLVVCTANLCRSPAMEAQLRAALGPGPGSFEVVSAGTRAREGLAAHPDTVAVLAERGLTLPDGWRSRRVREGDVARADLVLTATREHRGAVVALHPPAAGRTWTLRQFTRLLTAAGVPRPAGEGEHPGQALLRTALAGRGVGAPPARADADDLADPVGRPHAAFEQMADVVGADLATISRFLVPAR